MFSVSAIGCALCGSYQWLVFYRIVGGIGIGIVSIVSPMYISEIAVTEYRGRLVSLYQLAITVGFLGAYLINYWLLSVSESTRFDSELMNWIFVDEVWRGMLGMETLPALLFFIILFIIPESPRWLLLRGKVARSESIFGKIYSRKERVKKQVEELQAHIANETKSEFKYLFQPGILTAVVAGLCIAILGQFMGVNAVLYYGPTIFENAGLSGGDSLFYQVLIGVVNMGTTILALLIIDKIGRKKLVYYGVSGMIVSLLLIAFHISVSARTNANHLEVILEMVFNILFAI
jgi:sugar porter (SP) family MFS transporter